MTFWLYQPRQFFKSSSILPYKGKDVGDFLNFLTVFLLSFSLYIRNKVPQVKIQKLLIGGLLFILVLSLFTQNEETEVIDGIEIPKYSDYKFSLSVD